MKAEVAAQFIMERVKGVTVTPHCKRIQEFDEEFYSQFSIVICGLDNLPARRWINSTLCHLVEVRVPAHRAQVRRALLAMITTTHAGVRTQLDEDGDPDPSTIIPYIDGGTEGATHACACHSPVSVC